MSTTLPITDCAPPPHADSAYSTIVLVRSGILIGVFSANQTAAAASAAERLERAEGGSVLVYQIDAHLPPPPRAGAAVDPGLLQWLHLG